MKQKRLISVLLSLVLALSAMLSFNIIATADDTWSYDFDTHTLYVNANTGNYTEKTLNDRPWFEYVDATVKVVVAEGVTEIGDFAFARMGELEQIEIPNTVTRIGNTALGGNDKLMVVDIPSSVTEIDSFAFGYNYEMVTPEHFVAFCEKDSAAQRYCIQNYIPFDAPMTGFDEELNAMTDTAHITYANEQDMWSFVAPTNGVITFFSIGTKDTFGLIYDASSYAYSDSFTAMKESAVAYNDDDGGNLNFKITFNAERGKRYYLAAKNKRADRYDGSSSFETGRFDVAMTFDCTDHVYEEFTRFEPTCKDEGSIMYICVGCGEQYFEPLKKLDHTAGEPTRVDISPADCNGVGHYDMVTYCIECGDEIARENFDIEPLGHDEIVNETPADCHNPKHVVTTCSRCDYRHEETIGQPKAHTQGTPVQENVHDSTCQNPGSYDEVVYCIECGDQISRVQRTIEKKAHTYVPTVFAPTCTQGGYTRYECSECHEYYDAEPTDPTGHDCEIFEFDSELGKVYVMCKNEGCDYQNDFDFMFWYHITADDERFDEISVLDINKDGIINAKDYAIILRTIPPVAK